METDAFCQAGAGGEAVHESVSLPLLRRELFQPRHPDLHLFQPSFFAFFCVLKLQQSPADRAYQRLRCLIARFLSQLAFAIKYKNLYTSISKITVL
ncbi:MAG: hypothetical protein HGA90_07575 [Alphaproteobacteria bacterium]|nr:hypothetical protein [Alphaproteobacteria bacterium]